VLSVFGSRASVRFILAFILSAAILTVLWSNNDDRPIQPQKIETVSVDKFNKDANEVYCRKLADDPEKSLCDQSPSDQDRCSVSKELCRAHRERVNTFKTNNATYAIVTPLFPEHYDLFLVFLRSALTFVTDLDKFSWHVILGNQEEVSNLNFLIKREIKEDSTRINLKYWTLQDAVNKCDPTHPYDPSIWDNKGGEEFKFKWLSHKKFFGALVADADFVLLTDSEYRFLRPSSLGDMMYDYYSNPWYWSEESLRRWPLDLISDASLEVLGWKDRDINWSRSLTMWENQSWFMEKSILQAMAKHMTERHESVSKAIMSVRLNGWLFIDASYIWFIYLYRANQAPMYRIPKIEQVLKNRFTADQYEAYEKAKEGNGWGMFEQFSHWMRPDMFETIRDIFKEYKISLFRYDGTRKPPREVDCLYKALFEQSPTLKLQACAIGDFPENCSAYPNFGNVTRS